MGFCEVQYSGLRVKMFTGDARLGDKVKAAKLEHPEYIVVAGAKEASQGLVAIREGRGSRVVTQQALGLRPQPSFSAEALGREEHKPSRRRLVGRNAGQAASASG